MSGGGSNAQQTLGSWSPIMTGYWAGPDGSPERGFLERVQNESMTGYKPYAGDRVAGLNPDQTRAGRAMMNTAFDGTALGNAGRQAGLDTVQGKYLDTAKNFGSNEFGGMSNPYFRDVMKSGLEDITQSYNKGTALDTTRMANLEGAFGGSRHMDRVAQNQEALGKTLNQYTQQMQNQQYDRSAGLRESELSRNAGLYGQERGFMNSMTPTAMGNDANAISNYQQAMGWGNQQQGQSQRELDDAYSRWMDQQNWGKNQLGWLGGQLGLAQGSTGMTTQFGGYGGISPLAGILGAGALYGGLK